MAQRDPFDLAAGLAPFAQGDDRLLAPPANPLAPPQGLADALQSAMRKNADWASVPGRMFQGVQPSQPGQWSEEDEFRKQHLAQQPYSWGPQTAFSEVFWPRTGTNVGGSGFTVGSGATVPKGEAPKLSALTEQLNALKTSRSEFDARISSLSSELNANDLRAVVTGVTGYLPSSAKTKSDLVTTLHRHQRQWELNADRSAAQSKIRP